LVCLDSIWVFMVYLLADKRVVGMAFSCAAEGRSCTARRSHRKCERKRTGSRDKDLLSTGSGEDHMSEGLHSHKSGSP
jgi:hypothetical protein